MAKDDIGGVWRTIGGRRVFIKDGQSLSDAMKASGKFNLDDEYDRAHGAYKKEEQEINDRNKKLHRDAIARENQERLREFAKKYEQDIKGPDSKEVREINDRVTKDWGSSELEDTRRALASAERYLEKHPDDERMKKRIEIHKKDIARLEKQEKSETHKKLEKEMGEELVEHTNDQGKKWYSPKSLEDEEQRHYKQEHIDAYNKEKAKEKITSDEYNKKLNDEYNNLKSGKIDTEEYFKRTDDIQNKYTTDKILKGNLPENRQKELDNEYKELSTNLRKNTQDLINRTASAKSIADLDNIARDIQYTPDVNNDIYYSTMIKIAEGKSVREISKGLQEDLKENYNSTQKQWIKDYNQQPKEKTAPDSYKDSMITSRNNDEVIRDLNNRKEQLATHKDRYTPEEYKKQENGLNEGIRYAKQQKETTTNQTMNDAIRKKAGLSKSTAGLNTIDKIAGNDEKLQRLGREMGASSFSRWEKSFREYMKEHPNSKLDLYKYIKMNRD